MSSSLHTRDSRNGVAEVMRTKHGSKYGSCPERNLRFIISVHSSLEEDSIGHHGLVLARERESTSALGTVPREQFCS
jgi:hypothetical protein